MKKKISNKKVLITGAGSLIGQGVIKLIKNYKYSFKIVGADYFKISTGLFWCNKAYILPDILDKNITEKIWINSIIKIISKEKIDLILPCADFEIPLFSKYKDFLYENFKTIVLVSNLSLVNNCMDKWKTVNLLKKIGYNYPESHIFNNPDNINVKLRYPLIVKPRKGSTSKDVYKVKNKIELIKAIKKCNSPIIQEFLEGDEYTCGSLYLNEKVITVISLKRTLKNGNTSIAYSQNNKIVNNYIYNLTVLLKPNGPMNFQLKLTKNGPVIFEINPRFSGTTPIREKFGVNEFEAIYNSLYLNRKYNYQIKKGIVIRYFEDLLIQNTDLNKIKKI